MHFAGADYISVDFAYKGASYVVAHGASKRPTRVCDMLWREKASLFRRIYIAVCVCVCVVYLERNCAQLTEHPEKDAICL